MSQEKVAKYKEEKANRKSLVKKQKMQKLVGPVVASLVCVVLVGWIAWSAADTYDRNKKPDNVEVSYEALSDYLEELSE